LQSTFLYITRVSALRAVQYVRSLQLSTALFASVLVSHAAGLRTRKHFRHEKERTATLGLVADRMVARDPFENTFSTLRRWIALHLDDFVVLDLL